MYFLGVDIGTTSTKSIVFNNKGEIVSKAVKEYAINSTEVGFREQNPREILQAVIETLAESIKKADASPKDIRFVSFSSAMHSIIAVDEKGGALTECIIWADNRSVSYVEKAKSTGMAKKIYLRTGTPAHPMSPLYKLMWLKEHKPQIYNEAHKFISIKEYVFYHFFGQYIVDYSIASATGMFNIFNLDWDEEVLKLLNLDKERLSKTVPTTYVLNNLRDDICHMTGLSSESSFIIGASDGCLANLGSNAIEAGTAAATIGTSGAVRVVSEKPVTDEQGRVFCYVLAENKYVVGGAINNGGIVYRWFRDELSQEEVNRAKALNIDPYELLNKKVENTEAGSEGLLFLPFLTGERAPYWNANLRAAYVGISDRHKKRHLARALIEGICMDMNDVLQAVKELRGEVKRIYANGGFIRSREWTQILCDIFDTKIIISDNYESPCIGAVMLGLLAVGDVSCLEDCSYLVKESEVFTPRDKEKEVYKSLYKLYKNAIVSLIPILEELSNFSKK